MRPPGEIGEVLLIAANRTQARSAFRFIKGLLATPLLKPYVVGEPKRERIVLRNRIEISIVAASVAAGRAATAVACILDESAFLKTAENAVNRDTEILTSIRPSLGTTKGLLVCISSPWARRGAMWEAFSKSYGKDGDPVLVWKASTRTMHCGFDQKTIDDAYATDETAARTEYGGEFRADLEAFVDPLALAALVATGRTSQPPSIQAGRYFAFVDPAGGSGRDSMVLAISHLDHRRGVVVLDQIVEQKPPFSPEETVAGFAALLKEYRVRLVTGDRFGGDWPAERFRTHGITYVPSDRNKSQIYAEALPLFTGGACELLDDKRLLAQLIGLERRTAWGGRDSIDYGPGGHDDVANAVCGSLLLAAGSRRSGLRPTAVTSLQKPTVEILEPAPNRVRGRQF